MADSGGASAATARSPLVIAEGLPFFVKEASGGWTLEPLGDNRTRATTTINMQTTFWPLGALMERFMLGPQFGKTLDAVQQEFKRYVEPVAAEAKAEVA